MNSSPRPRRPRCRTDLAHRWTRHPGQRCTRPRAAVAAPGTIDGALGRLVARAGTTGLDLLDISLVDTVLAVAGQPPLPRTAHAPGRFSTRMTAEQVAALRAVSLDSPEDESWMLVLAPALLPGVLRLTGEDWRAEAELAVELVPALRSDELADLGDVLMSGVLVDTTRTAEAVVADAVLDPALALLI